MANSVLSPDRIVNVDNWVVSVVNVSGKAVLVVEGAVVNGEGRMFVEKPFAWSVEILNDESWVYPSRRINLTPKHLQDYLQHRHESWDAKPSNVETMSVAINNEVKEAMIPEAKGQRIPYQYVGADHPLGGLFGSGHNSASWCNAKLRIAIPGIENAIPASKPKKIGCVIL